MNKDSIVVSLPYPHKVLGVTFSVNRKIGFSFTNYSIFLFRENTGVKDAKEYEAWVNVKGEAALAAEMMFAAASAYTNDRLKRPNFTKEKLIHAIASSSKEVQKQITDAWNHSQNFGLKVSKKKAVIKTKR